MKCGSTYRYQALQEGDEMKKRRDEEKRMREKNSQSMIFKILLEVIINTYVYRVYFTFLLALIFAEWMSAVSCCSAIHPATSGSWTSSGHSIHTAACMPSSVRSLRSTL